MLRTLFKRSYEVSNQQLIRPVFREGKPTKLTIPTIKVDDENRGKSRFSRERERERNARMKFPINDAREEFNLFVSNFSINVV